MRWGVLDFETSGLKPSENCIVQVGIVVFEGIEHKHTMSKLVKPYGVWTSQAEAVHGFPERQAREHGHDPKTIMARVVDVLNKLDVFVTFNGIAFDMKFLEAGCKKFGVKYEVKTPHVDAMLLTRSYLNGYRGPNRKLATLASHFGVALSDPNIGSVDNLHNAVYDAKITGHMLIEISERFKVSLEDLLLGKPVPAVTKDAVGMDPMEAMYAGFQDQRKWGNGNDDWS